MKKHIDDISDFLLKKEIIPHKTDKDTGFYIKHIYYKIQPTDSFFNITVTAITDDEKAFDGNFITIILRLDISNSYEEVYKKVLSLNNFILKTKYTDIIK